MPKLIWDEVGKRFYETGVDHGVLYPMSELGAYETGVPWNGLISVSESPSGGEPSPQYADNIKYLNLMSVEEFNCSIEAYTYPDEFAPCDGSVEVAPGVMAGQQNRRQFGLAYRTRKGNDVEHVELGYKIHLVWGCLASPSEKSYQTINDSPEAMTFSWEVTTTPIEVAGYRPISSLVIDSTKVDAADLAALEELLFGNETTGTATLPTPQEVITLMTPEG